MIYNRWWVYVSGCRNMHYGPVVHCSHLLARKLTRCGMTDRPWRFGLLLNHKTTDFPCSHLLQWCADRFARPLLCLLFTPAWMNGILFAVPESFERLERVFQWKCCGSVDNPQTPLPKHFPILRCQKKIAGTFVFMLASGTNLPFKFARKMTSPTHLF